MEKKKATQRRRRVQDEYVKTQNTNKNHKLKRSEVRLCCETAMHACRWLVCATVAYERSMRPARPEATYARV